MPICHCDRLLEVTKTVDSDLIQDVVNLFSPLRETHVH